MAIEIDQAKLGELFADPAEFYELVASRRGYAPRPVADFDAELISPGWIAMNHGILYVMVHKERKAYPILLSSEDLTDLRATLEQLQIQLNGAALINHSRTGFGFGLTTR